MNLDLEHSNIMDKAVVLILNLHKVGQSRKVHPSEIDVDADKDLLRVSKTILDSPQADAIRKFDARVKKWVYSRSSQSPLTNGGIYVLPLAVYEEADDQLKEFQAYREALVDNLLEAVPDIKKQDEKRLKTLCDPEDYPSLAQIRAAYRMEWHYWSFSAPDALKTVSREAYNRAKDEEVRKCRQVGDLARNGLRVAMAKLVDHLVESLSGKRDGKRKKFHESTITKLQDFIAMVPKLDITNDAALQDLAKRAEALVRNVDLKELKKDEGTQNNILAGFEKIQKKMDGMMIERPKRAISLKEDEAA